MNEKICFMCYHCREDKEGILNGARGFCLLKSKLVYLNNTCELFEPFIVEEKKNGNPS